MSKLREDLIDHDQDCPGCGCKQKTNRRKDDNTLRECQRCGALKCECCDMGDDVECISCEGADE